ncbi:MAG: hypothetical protein IPI19_13360 [Ignavibacteriales bacterium]|nr:hypothetical protein [Ignavibacteriales bacterium]
MASDVFSFGVGYGRSSGDVNVIDRSNLFTLGAIYRPASSFIQFYCKSDTEGEREGIIGRNKAIYQCYNLHQFEITILQMIKLLRS